MTADPRAETSDWRPTPPPGHAWMWVPSTSLQYEQWELLDDGRPVAAKGCRFTTGPGRRQCKAPSVAALNRGTEKRPQRWNYCEVHLFGRRLRDGVLETCVLRPTEQG